MILQLVTGAPAMRRGTPGVRTRGHDPSGISGRTLWVGHRVI